jgi:FixJ family two-component response regulator
LFLAPAGVAERGLNAADAIVFVVDDDTSFRDSVELLIRSEGIKTRGFGSADEFLASQIPDAPACLVLDVHLPTRRNEPKPLKQFADADAVS